MESITKLASAIASLSLVAIGDSKHVDTVEDHFGAAFISLVDVSTFGGSINVVGEDRSDVHVTAEKGVKNANREEAQSIFEEIAYAAEIRENTLYISFNYENARSRRPIQSRKSSTPPADISKLEI